MILIPGTFFQSKPKKKFVKIYISASKKGIELLKEPNCQHSILRGEESLRPKYLSKNRNFERS